MASVTWIGSSGDWSDAADWSTGTVPGAGDDVTIPPFGYYQVTVSSPIHVGSIQIESYGETIAFSTPGKKDAITGDVMNGGGIYVDTGYNESGTTLSIGGTLTNLGTLSVGASFEAPASGTTVVKVAHLDNLGTLDLAGGTNSGFRAELIDTGDAAPTTLESGTINLTGNALLEFASGSITSIASGAYLSLNGADARIADAGAIGSNSALGGLTSNAGQLTIQNGAKFTNLGSDFDNSGTFNIIGSKFSTQSGVDFGNTGTLNISYEQNGVSNISIGGTLTNSGSLNIGSGYASTSTVVHVAHLDNTGAITLYGWQYGTGDGITLLDDRGDVAPATLTAGVTWNISGAAMLEFGSGTISGVDEGATLELDGSDARVADEGHKGYNSAMSGFADNAGTVTLSDGVILGNAATAFTNSGTYSILNNTSVATNSGVNFTNSGTLYLDSSQYNGQYSGSMLSVGGTLTNSGTLSIGSAYSFTGNSRSEVLAQNFVNTGTLDIQGSTQTSYHYLAELIDKSDLAPTTLQSGVSINLTGDALLQFAGGSITNIAAGAQLSLDGFQARIADSATPTINSALTALSNNAGTLMLSDGANLGNGALAFTNSGTFSISEGTSVATNAGVDFSNSGTLNIDVAGSQGGSLLDIGGTLTNSGTITIGQNGGLTNATNLVESSEVFANHLVNTGTINLFSSEGSQNQALFNDDGEAAPLVLAAGASFNLVGNAVLEFGSGHIREIAAGAQITVDGTDAYIADAAHPSWNSALTELATNAGTLTLADGASMGNNHTSFTNSGIFSLLEHESFHLTQNFTNSGTLNLDTGGDVFGGQGQSDVTVDGTLDNSGTINIGSNVNPLSGASTITTAHFAELGTINIASFGLAFQTTYLASLNVLDDSAPGALAAGTSLNLHGDALLQFASGGITDISVGAEISLDGTQAFIADNSNTSANSALTGLVTNAGTLSLANGGIINNGTNDFDNSGTLNVSATNTQSDTKFVIGGTLTNDGSINISNTNHEAATNALLRAGIFINTGSISLSGEEAGLAVGGAATNMGTVIIGDGTYLGSHVSGTDTYIQQSGETDLNSGTLSAAHGVQVTGGVLQGTGLIQSGIDVSGGIFAAGMFTQSSTGNLNLGTQLSVESGGTIGTTLVAASDTSGVFEVENGVHLNGGTLDLNITDPGNLTAGEVFTIVTYGTKLSGQFNQIEANGIVGDATSVDLGDGFSLDVVYNTGTHRNIQVEVVADAPALHPAAVPSLQDTFWGVDAHGALFHHLAQELELHLSHAASYDFAPLG